MSVGKRGLTPESGSPEEVLGELIARLERAVGGAR